MEISVQNVVKYHQQYWCCEHLKNKCYVSDILVRLGALNMWGVGGGGVMGRVWGGGASL